MEAKSNASLRDNAMMKTAVYKLVTRFTEGRASVTDEERSGQPQRAELKITLQKFVKFA
jgi:hypothetical protein